jgi:hypothetical protein
MKNCCYIMYMSRHSAKATGRSAKTAQRSVKKNAKSARKDTRAGDKKAPKTARSRVAKSTRAAPAQPQATATAVAASMIRTASPPVQPVMHAHVPVRRHRYNVGEEVYYTSPTFGRTSASGNYTVVKLLPSDGDDYQYRIKSSGEAFERVAKESQLDKL